MTLLDIMPFHRPPLFSDGPDFAMYRPQMATLWATFREFGHRPGALEKERDLWPGQLFHLQLNVVRPCENLA
jgi:hypothetical protein